MQHVTSLAKDKTRAIALAGSGLVIAAMSLGLSATTSANSYSGNWNSWNNNWHSSHDRHNDHRSHRVFKWVFDPRLHRWVLVSFVVWDNRWDGGRNWGNNW